MVGRAPAGRDSLLRDPWDALLRDPARTSNEARRRIARERVLTKPCRRAKSSQKNAVVFPWSVVNSGHGP